MKKFILLLILVAISSGSAQAANWIKYKTASSNSTYYYDKNTVKIKRFSNGVKYIEAWEKSVEGSTHSKTLINYDCWHDRIGISRNIDYNSSGSVIRDNTARYFNANSASSWDGIIPDTVGEGKIKEICRAYRNYLK